MQLAAKDLVHPMNSDHILGKTSLQTLLISVEFEGKIFSGWSKKAFPILMHFSRNSGSHDEKSCAPFFSADNDDDEKRALK